MASLSSRRDDLARQWRVTVDESFETETSWIMYGRRDDQRVVLKVVKTHGDEWRSGDVVAAFDGCGVVRVLEYMDGALLLERLEPGTSLATLALAGRDVETTAILADVIGRMSPTRMPTACPTVHDWGEGFTRYATSVVASIPPDLVADAGRRFAALCASQRNPRLLHGDLQHSNVLFDRDRGWVAIDPKGVVGEIEYEIGAAIRNPNERPDLFLDPAVIERRLNQFASRLNIDRERAAEWSFAQAVLSAIWEIEDGHVVEPEHPSLRLAATLQSML